MTETKKKKQAFVLEQDDTDDEEEDSPIRVIKARNQNLIVLTGVHCSVAVDTPNWKQGKAFALKTFNKFNKPRRQVEVT